MNSRTVEQQRAYRATRPMKAAEYQRRYGQKYPDRVKASGRKHYLKIRTLINASKDKPCKDCKVSYPSYVMDFDHKNPCDKLFNVGEGGVGYEALKLEILKCDVVCSNCHRIRTFDRTYRRDESTATS